MSESYSDSVDVWIEAVVEIGKRWSISDNEADDFLSKHGYVEAIEARYD